MLRRTQRPALRPAKSSAKSSALRSPPTRGPTGLFSALDLCTTRQTAVSTERLLAAPSPVPERTRRYRNGPSQRAPSGPHRPFGSATWVFLGDNPRAIHAKGRNGGWWQRLPTVLGALLPSSGPRLRVLSQAVASTPCLRQGLDKPADYELRMHTRPSIRILLEAPFPVVRLAGPSGARVARLARPTRWEFSVPRRGA